MKRSSLKRVSREQGRFQLYPINWGSVNRPLGERRRRGHSKGGSPPSRPCPPNVDPDTGEIIERKSDRILNAIGFGEPMPEGLRKWKRQHPSGYGAGHLRRAFIPMPQKPGGKVARLVVAGIIGATIIAGVLTYHPEIPRPILPEGTIVTSGWCWGEGGQVRTTHYTLPDGRSYREFRDDWYDEHRDEGKSLLERFLLSQ